MNQTESGALNIIYKNYKHLLYATRRDVQCRRESISTTSTGTMRMARFRGAENVDRKKDLITFEEFIDLLLSIRPSNYDLHWQRYSDRCEPCLVPYDFVGTLKDVPVMYSALGMTNRSRLWVNKGPSDTKNVALSYFSRLPRSKVERLYSIYAVDFTMFGYSAKEYLQRGQQNRG
ncbi:hypothetical protein MRX96_039813 [Rhipicephalus microplus]